MKAVARYTNLLEKLFFVFWWASLSARLMNVLSDKDSFFKFFKTPVPYLLFAAVAIGIGILFLDRKSKHSILQRSAGVIRIIFIVLTSLFVSLKIINLWVHVQPDVLFWPAVVSLWAVILVKLQKINRVKKQDFSNAIFIISFGVILVNGVATFNLERWAIQFILRNPNASYSDKMKEAVGPVFYNLMQFIKTQTAEDSSILLPPQMFPWPRSGNAGYVRYFLYPRVLKSGKEYSLGNDLQDFDYVVLNSGETGEFNPDYGWPKFDVPAEEIIFMNGDGSLKEAKKESYHYKEYVNKEVWGLIKIKH